MWDTFSKILNVIQAILLFYFYFENRKLKGFETEKKLTIKKAELEKLMDDHIQDIAGATIFSRGENIQKRESDFAYKKICLEAEITELEKIIKRYNLK